MSGLVCPQCGGVFRAGFTRCATCQVDLVDAATVADLKKKVGSPRAALADVATVPIIHAGLAACREIERALLDEGIPCYVEANAEEGEALAPGALKVGVIVAEADVPKVGDLLKRRFEDLVKKEGVGSFNLAAIDLSASEIECPACGHKGALTDAGACGDCGLFLGAPE